MASGAKKEQKTKAQKLLAAQSASKKARSKKKQLTATKDKKAYKVLLSEKEHADVLNHLKKMTMVTPHLLSERAKITISLAKMIMKEKMVDGSLQLINQIGSLLLCKSLLKKKGK
eukprot:GAHX01000083.1.p1 GENE.GAHX01000083.1~~GAHX01000083.1.p1  ORF type:complete len:115 (+),score=25.99 GAHX01000083.1:43-387(+)